MANLIPNSFRGELFSGTHNFASGGDTFKIALYTGSIAAVYTTSSTVVSSTMKLIQVEEVTIQDKLCLHKQLHLQQLLLQLTLEIQLGQVQLLQQRMQLFIMMIKEISYV